MIAAYDTWWDDQFPVMIVRGGDAGDPQESAKAAELAKKAKAAVAARKVADAPAENVAEEHDANEDGGLSVDEM